MDYRAILKLDCDRLIGAFHQEPDELHLASYLETDFANGLGESQGKVLMLIVLCQDLAPCLDRN